jgi:hypothetical protein
MRIRADEDGDPEEDELTINLSGYCGAAQPKAPFNSGRSFSIIQVVLT